MNNETNISETPEGNAVKNAVCDFLWDNYQRRNLNTV
jgi:hypothetical protein